MAPKSFYYLFCNHWTQSGIGFAFKSGWYNNKKYDKVFSSVYTINKMLDAADDYPGLKASMELDAYTYEEVLKEDPACINRLIEYIRIGKAGIDGGTYGQPFGQDYGWEPNIRHLTVGRETIKNILHYHVKAFLVEEQWFHPQLPQLLLKSGFKYASLQNQNSGQVKPINEAMINWVGLDGSKLPTIPANDLQISCVRQYTDYAVYEKRLEDYLVPLLFQWVEIWTPGMDWGASATPYDKAIRQVFKWGGNSVTLGDYFELEASKRSLRDVYIPLDESNYANNWYQGGGWGYDGDKVIMWDKKSEKALLAFEWLASMASLKNKHRYPHEILTAYWKKLMLLQNHDFSVARSYRAVTDAGLVTEAGSLCLVEYEALTQACNEQTIDLISQWSTHDKDRSASHYVILNSTDIAHKKTIELEVTTEGQDSVRLLQGNVPIVFQAKDSVGGKIRGLAVVDLPAFGTTSLHLSHGAKHEEPFVQSGDTWIEDDHYRLDAIPNTWTIQITDKRTGEHVEYTGLSGPIGKVNEHDGNKFHALSPAHEVFTFAFDGTVHAPDQNARISATVETVGPVKSTLSIRSDLLTLHTTPTPVAFAKVRVSIEHGTGRIECQSHFYSGVYLNLQCWATFKHSLPRARYHRDFPFGEEETHIEYVYPNTYMRVANETHGFTVVHPGVQRARVLRSAEGGEVKHLLARDRMLGDYTWTFSVHFGNHTPWESAKLAKTEQGFTPVLEDNSYSIPTFLEVSNKRVLVSAIYEETDGRSMVRLINYSPEVVLEAVVTYDNLFRIAQITDFTGTMKDSVAVRHANGKSLLTLNFNPWEIITIALWV